MADVIKIKVSETPKVADIKRFIVLGLDRTTNQSAHADMEQLKGNTAYQEWAEKNPTATYEDYIAMLQAPATAAAEQVTDDMESISSEWGVLADSVARAIIAAGEATEEAQTAADNVQDGKTPQFGVGDVAKTPAGGNPTVSLTANGTDASGNPKFNIDMTLPTGDTGPVPVVQVGTVTTGQPGSSATAELAPNGTTETGVQKYLLNMSIPQGQPGTGSGNVFVTTTGLLAAKTYLFKPGANGSPEGTFVEYVAPVIPTKTSDLTKDDVYTQAQTNAQIDNKIALHLGTVYKPMGSVPTYDDLPTEGNVAGHVYNVLDTGHNYAWIGMSTAHPDGWDQLAGDVDLSNYYTIEQIDAKLSFEGVNTVNTPVGAPVNKPLCIVNLTANASFSAQAGMIAGRSVSYKLVNATAAAITITIPTTGGYEAKVSSIAVPAGSWSEVNIACYVAGVYNIKTEEG